MNTFNKNTLFKIALLLILSIKVSFFVVENYSATDFSIEKTSLADIEDSESEEKEIDEQKKIFEYAFNSKSTAINTVKNHYKYSLEKYNSRYLEYTTPPPEGVSSLYV